MPDVASGPCNPACSKVIRFMVDQKIPANSGISIGSYKNVDHYRYVNIFVQFSQTKANEAPVNLGVIFSVDSKGAIGARRYVNLEENVAGPQDTNMIDVSGANSWHGSQHGKSSYLVRLPVMGPYVQVFPFNRATVDRNVTIMGYLVS